MADKNCSNKHKKTGKPPGSYKAWQDIARVLATKGVVAFKRGVALATRGVLDLIKRQPRRPAVVHPFQKVYNIIGKKGFCRVDEWEIIGQVQRDKVSTLIEIKGTKETEFVKAVTIESVVEYPFISVSSLEGVKSFEFTGVKDVQGIAEHTIDSQIETFGIKECELEKVTSVEGTKRFGFDCLKEITGIKRTPLQHSSIIKGTKRISHKTSHHIKGKRDITAILEALDLI